MSQNPAAARYRFGTFEADAGTGEIRRQGLRIRLAEQPFQLLLLLLERAGQLVTRDEICRALWPEGTFVDYEHGVNSAVNRIREALRDPASNPRFIETRARRGYRFIAPVERIDGGILSGHPVSAPTMESAHAGPGFTGRILASEEDLPRSSPRVVRTLFILFQLMYLGFYVGALANLGEIHDLVAPLPHAVHAYLVIVVTAGVLIPVRMFLGSAALFQPPGMKARYLRIWPVLLVLDLLWASSPLLLIHHINVGLALACAAFLVYSPFVQRSLILMGAAGRMDAAGRS
jgi:DNA-binding winged helix-turn-helix (wHTH) protein